jgi:phage tail sheath protein FI
LLDNNKNVSIPPSAHVSNLFVQKFLNGTPYAIVAGPRRGLITDPNLVGVEYDLSDSDRANLQPFGINPIVRLKGTGVMIFGNETGYQQVNSALNNLHVRDLLVTIEDDIETILGNYLYEFNEASTRLEISSVVTSYLEGVLSAGGITDFEVIMDTSNNTPAIIDQNFGIIDVIVEPAHGIQKFINRVTIAKTGAISSGGFTVSA